MLLSCLLLMLLQFCPQTVYEHLIHLNSFFYICTRTTGAAVRLCAHTRASAAVNAAAAAAER
jgi:hypothetical protein